MNGDSFSVSHPLTVTEPVRPSELFTQAPVADDPIDVVHKKIRQRTIAFTTEMVALVQELLGREDATPPTHARALHLLEGIASVQSAMLQLLGGLKRRPRNHRGKIMLGGGLYDDDYNDPYAELLSPETYTGAAQAETFGNKALQQLIETMKPLMQEGGLMGLASSGKNKAAEIESLTRALADAKQAKLGRAITAPIEEKLKLALAPKPSPEPLALVSGQQEEAP